MTKTNYDIARASLERSKANVAKSEIAIPAYLKGRYVAQMQQLQKDLAARQRNLRVAKKMLASSEKLFRQGFITDLEVRGNSITVTQAKLELKVKETEIHGLKTFTKKMMLETLRGNLTADKSKRESDEHALKMEEKRRDRAKMELDACTIRAPQSGLVIYPSAAAWKRTPDITEGATVRKDQVLLLMPDLTKMQVKVGVHESIVDRVHPGLDAKVTLGDKTHESQVYIVNPVAAPAGWWTGNVVKYDTVVKLPTVHGLKPGMSAEVEVVIAHHRNVLKIPTGAVIQTKNRFVCWVKTTAGVERRAVKLGDAGKMYLVLKGGVADGEQVVLNPLAEIPEAQAEAASTIDDSRE